MGAARRSINDFWMIRAYDGKRLEPRDTLRLYRIAVLWRDAELSKPFDGKTVVVTHFAPHRQCVAEQHEGSDVSPFFVTKKRDDIYPDTEGLMEKHRIDLWSYGHTHTNSDFVTKDGGRVVSNQRGYPSEGEQGFRPDLVIEV